MKVFKEEQRFTQFWIIALVIISGIIPLGIIVGTFIKDSSQYSIFEFLIILGIIAFASGIIFIFKLATMVDNFGIYYKFFPFHLRYKVIKWSEINKAYIRKYDALSEYGGWGLKGGSLFNKSKGTAITISGEIGIQLELNNGKKLLIGTQKEELAKSVIETYKLKMKNHG